MIYALNTRDISDHERREIARHIRDDRSDILRRDIRIVYACDTNVGEDYLCIYCMKTVRKWWRLDRVRFDHAKGEGCIGSDHGLPGIVNPTGVTTVCPSDE